MAVAAQTNYEGFELLLVALSRGEGDDETVYYRVFIGYETLMIDVTDACKQEDWPANWKRSVVNWIDAYVIRTDTYPASSNIRDGDSHSKDSPMPLMRSA
jgi:hypothetical protein